MDASSRMPSLDRRVTARKNPGPSNFTVLLTRVPNVVHRFEESIAGRSYLIEVASVSQDRWRAYIVRVPNVPTALMPFYGRTPAEAAQSLTDWLNRAHQRPGPGPTG